MQTTKSLEQSAMPESDQKGKETSQELQTDVWLTLTDTKGGMHLYTTLQSSPLSDGYSLIRSMWAILKKEERYPFLTLTLREESGESSTAIMMVAKVVRTVATSEYISQDWPSVKV